MEESRPECKWERGESENVVIAEHLVCREGKWRWVRNNAVANMEKMLSGQAAIIEEGDLSVSVVACYVNIGNNTKLLCKCMLIVLAYEHAYCIQLK